MGQSLYDQLDLFRDLSPTTKHIVEQASLEKRILSTVHYFSPREFQLFLFTAKPSGPRTVRVVVLVGGD